MPHPTGRGFPTVPHCAGFGIINATPAMCSVFKIQPGPLLSVLMTEKKRLSVWLPRLSPRCVTCRRPSILCLDSVSPDLVLCHGRILVDSLRLLRIFKSQVVTSYSLSALISILLTG